MKALSEVKVSYGLLNLDVKVYPLRSKEDKISFNGLSECCKNITGLKRYCKSCLKELAWKQELKGFKVGKNEYIQLTKDELDTIEKLENGIQIIKFIKSDEIDLSILDKVYLLEAVNSISKKLYSLFNNLFAELSIYALCRTIIKGSEHFSILRHNKTGLIMQYIEKIDGLTIDTKGTYLEAEYIQLKEIIKQSIGNFNFDELKPIYATKIKELIELKAQGKTIELKEITTERLDTNLLATLKAMSKTEKKIERMV